MDNYALDSHYGEEVEGEEYDDFNEGGSLGEYSGAGQHDSHGFGGFDNFKQGQMGPMMDPSMLYATYRFTFDYVYDQDSTQEELYLRSAQHVVLSILQGYNAAMIAYGQTGTGKTYTVEGDLEGPNRGIIPRTVEDIFTYIVNDPEPTSKYLVRASYLQIYNEVISDLLKPDRTNLAIREDKRRGVFVEGLSEWVVRSPGEVYQLMARGQSLRATGATKLNEMSSRSHAVCIIIVEKCTTNVSEEAAAALSRPSSSREGGLLPHNIKVGKLNLVDLAGSERVHVTGAVGKRLEESKKINASLSALGNVIAALTDPRGERTHIPYRDSKLTRILEDSLGGNCRTTMVCTVAPSMEAFQESLSTLKFANRAKNIKNEAHVNEDLDQKTLLRKYERELRRLRQELQRRSKQLVDKRSLLEAEEQKRRAEADKLAALTALEKRSKEFLKEKEEKKALEMKIRAMQSQMLVGGVALGPGGSEADAAAGGPARAPVPGNGNAASWENAPAFKQLLLKEHRRIRDEYEKRLKELEGERQTVEEDRLQVDRYKQLLLKQRDIMIALTARLNERDEQIMALQEELEACDKYQQQLEDALDAKTAELIALRKVIDDLPQSPHLLILYS
ncbi:P-loop containing nucleoside triphosphate hydrolase protein [Dunaliella salina]|uniref:Kinesin-like protein n=1 Tax=Dunaliella salina TaxID=3046 RepID=A0ABQ7GKN6_DUNSA|nr:P-loop containing nucleoside triphosphate hydrolase protein [Dunaliella salina]|eukprot:KAF5835168.1 P-loop containing nucleoside triphosphate hydrolase protein [Dunaliella salina]